MVPGKLSPRKRALKFQSSLISQACFSSETLKMQVFLFSFFFFVSACKMGVIVPGIPSGDRGNGG